MRSDKAYSVILSSASNRSGHKMFNEQKKAEIENLPGTGGSAYYQHAKYCTSISHLILIITLQSRNYYPYFTNDRIEAQNS